MVPLTPGIYPENFVPGGKPVPEIFGHKWWFVFLCVCLPVCQSRVNIHEARVASTRREQPINIHEPTAYG